MMNNKLSRQASAAGVAASAAIAGWCFRTGTSSTPTVAGRSGYERIECGGRDQDSGLTGGRLAGGRLRGHGSDASVCRAWPCMRLLDWTLRNTSLMSARCWSKLTFMKTLYQLPRDFNAANMWLNTKLLGKPDWMPGEDVNTLSPDGPGWRAPGVGRLAALDLRHDSNLLTEERVAGGEWRGTTWSMMRGNRRPTIRIVEALEHVLALTRDGYVVERGFAENLSGFLPTRSVCTRAGASFTGFLQDAGKPGTYDAQFWPRWQAAAPAGPRCGDRGLDAAWDVKWDVTAVSSLRGARHGALSERDGTFSTIRSTRGRTRARSRRRCSRSS